MVMSRQVIIKRCMIKRYGNTARSSETVSFYISRSIAESEER